METWDAKCSKETQEDVINKTFKGIGLTEQEADRQSTKQDKNIGSTFNILLKIDRTKRIQNFYEHLVTRETNLKFMNMIEKDLYSEINRMPNKSTDANQNKVSVYKVSVLVQRRQFVQLLTNV
jgi:hypothetical protein